MWPYPKQFSYCRPEQIQIHTLLCGSYLYNKYWEVSPFLEMQHRDWISLTLHLGNDTKNRCFLDKIDCPTNVLPPGQMFGDILKACVLQQLVVTCLSSQLASCGMQTLYKFLYRLEDKWHTKNIIPILTWFNPSSFNRSMTAFCENLVACVLMDICNVVYDTQPLFFSFIFSAAGVPHPVDMVNDWLRD